MSRSSEPQPRTALVTGSGSGIGAAVAKHLAQPGTRLLIHARSNQDGCEKTADAGKTAGGEAQIMLGDLAEPDTAGKLGLNEDFIHEGILGTIFTGRLMRETTVGDYNAVVPTISGQAWVTGIAQYVLDPDDPFPNGFTLGDIWGGGG